MSYANDQDNPLINKGLTLHRLIIISMISVCLFGVIYLIRMNTILSIFNNDIYVNILFVLSIAVVITGLCLNLFSLISGIYNLNKSLHFNKVMTINLLLGYVFTLSLFLRDWLLIYNLIVRVLNNYLFLLAIILYAVGLLYGIILNLFYLMNKNIGKINLNISFRKLVIYNLMLVGCIFIASSFRRWSLSRSNEDLMALVFIGLINTFFVRRANRISESDQSFYSLLLRLLTIIMLIDIFMLLFGDQLFPVDNNYWVLSITISVALAILVIGTNILFLSNNNRWNMSLPTLLIINMTNLLVLGILWAWRNWVIFFSFSDQLELYGILAMISLSIAALINIYALYKRYSNSRYYY